MVEQPREAVEEPALLELPAGKLDVEGETPLECAQRELVEEIGKSAGDWRELKSFYTSPRLCHRARLALPGDRAVRRAQRPVARGADRDRRDPPRAGSTTRSRRCEDAKSLIGLLMLKQLL